MDRQKNNSGMWWAIAYAIVFIGGLLLLIYQQDAMAPNLYG